MKPLILSLATGLLAVAAGCSANNGPPMYDVEGFITFDGAPLESGRILFRQTERDERAYSTEIVNGAYSLETQASEMSVQIRASRLIPGKFDMVNGKPHPVGKMYVPAKYNAKTELTAVVTADGENQFDFDLTSK